MYRNPQCPHCSNDTYVNNTYYPKKPNSEPSVRYRCKKCGKTITRKKLEEIKKEKARKRDEERRDWGFFFKQLERLFEDELTRPQYKYCWDHLSRDGRAYVLEANSRSARDSKALVVGNGRTFVVEKTEFDNPERGKNGIKYKITRVSR